MGRKKTTLSFIKKILLTAAVTTIVTAVVLAVTPNQASKSKAAFYSRTEATTQTILVQDFTKISKLDPKIWNNTGKLPWGTRKNIATGEIQNYSVDAVSLTSEGLCLTAQRKPDGNWVSGSIDTQGKFSVGPETIVSIRYKLPQNNGTKPGFTPALWMGAEPENGQWVWPPEIDAIEGLGQDGFKVAHTTLHYNDDQSILNTESYANKLKNVYTHPGPNVSTGWNTVVIDRRNGQLVVSHNGIITLKVMNAAIVPKHNMYLLLSFPIGVGGDTWAGKPDQSTPEVGKFYIASIKVEKILQKK